MNYCVNRRLNSFYIFWCYSIDIALKIIIHLLFDIDFNVICLKFEMKQFFENFQNRVNFSKNRKSEIFKVITQK